MCLKIQFDLRRKRDNNKKDDYQKFEQVFKDHGTRYLYDC